MYFKLQVTVLPIQKVPLTCIKVACEQAQQASRKANLRPKVTCSS